MPGKPEQLYVVHDLGLAGALVTCAHEMTRLVRLSPTKCSFEFRHSPELIKDVEAYFQRNLGVDAATFWDEVRTLKNRMKTV